MKKREVSTLSWLNSSLFYCQALKWTELYFRVQKNRKYKRQAVIWKRRISSLFSHYCNPDATSIWQLRAASCVVWLGCAETPASAQGQPSQTPFPLAVTPISYCSGNRKVQHLKRIFDGHYRNCGVLHWSGARICGWNGTNRCIWAKPLQQCGGEGTLPCNQRLCWMFWGSLAISVRKNSHIGWSWGVFAGGVESLLLLFLSWWQGTEPHKVKIWMLGFDVTEPCSACEESRCSQVSRCWEMLCQAHGEACQVV